MQSLEEQSGVEWGEGRGEWEEMEREESVSLVEAGGWAGSGVGGRGAGRQGEGRRGREEGRRGAENVLGLK